MRESVKSLIVYLILAIAITIAIATLLSDIQHKEWVIGGCLWVLVFVVLHSFRKSIQRDKVAFDEGRKGQETGSTPYRADSKDGVSVRLPSNDSYFTLLSRRMRRLVSRKEPRFTIGRRSFASGLTALFVTIVAVSASAFVVAVLVPGIRMREVDTFVNGAVLVTLLPVGALLYFRLRWLRPVFSVSLSLGPILFCIGFAISVLNKELLRPLSESTLESMITFQDGIVIKAFFVLVVVSEVVARTSFWLFLAGIFAGLLVKSTWPDTDGLGITESEDSSKRRD